MYKVNFFRRMKAFGKWRFNSTVFTSALDGNERSASPISLFTPGVRWIGGCLGDGLGNVRIIRLLYIFRASNHDFSVARSLITMLLCQCASCVGSNNGVGLYIVLGVFIPYNFVVLEWNKKKKTSFNNCPTRCDYIQFYYIFCRQLCMFRIIPSSIIMSTFKL